MVYNDQPNSVAQQFAYNVALAQCTVLYNILWNISQDNPLLEITPPGAAGDLAIVQPYFQQLWPLLQDPYSK